MNSSERRKFKRLGAKFDIFCREVGSAAEQPYIGCTINVSPGGLYFETAAETFKPGNLLPGSLLKVELSIPPTPGLLKFGGKIAAFARVLRNSNLSDPSLSNKYGVALQFCQSPKLCT